MEGPSGDGQAIRLKEPQLRGEEASVWLQQVGQCLLGSWSQFPAFSGLLCPDLEAVSAPPGVLLA